MTATDYLPGAADAAANAMADAGEIPVLDGNGPVKPKRDVAVTTAPGPHPPQAPPTVDWAPDFRGAHELPVPPDARLPAWAMPQAPLRDAAQVGLFREEMERADSFWLWLYETRQRYALRAQNGYAYLAQQRKPEAEDVALYKSLLRWVSWTDACLWLLTAWYSPHHATPQPRALVLPFLGLVDAKGEGAMLVRELDGLNDKFLLENVLAQWAALSLSSGYLERLDEEENDA